MQLTNRLKLKALSKVNNASLEGDNNCIEENKT